MDNSQCLLYTMGHTGESAGGRHSIQKFTLVRARVLTGELDLDIQGPTVADTVPHDIALAVVPDVHDGAVLCIELAHRVVSGYAAVLTQSCDDLILENRFSIDKTASLVGGDLVSL